MANTPFDIELDPSVTIQGSKMLSLFAIMKGADLNVDQMITMSAGAVVEGLVSKDPRPKISDEERDRRDNEEGEREALRKRANDWLKTHEGPAYNGSRETGRSMQELIALIGLPPKRRNLDKLLKPILESETTGWGLVGVHDRVPVYGRKAILIGFAPLPARPEAPAAVS